MTPFSRITTRTVGSGPVGAPSNPSFWILTTPDTHYPTLAGEIDVDVCVVGAGITGLTAATLLKREGKTVAVVEAKRIVHGATGYTTAKVTSGHGAIYGDLEDNFGAAGARIYADSNEAALARVAQFVEEDGIDCDFERKANYVFAESPDEVAQLKREVDAAKRAGLDVSFTAETSLPLDVAGALRLENQGQFHPRKYLLALAETIPGDGSHVFEQTTAQDVKGTTVRASGGTVRAKDVIVATHLPFEDSGLFFTKAHPHRSYAVAAPIDPSAAPDGMFINAGVPTRSVRTIRAGERLLIQVGGEGHKIGDEDDTKRRYRTLESYLGEHWPQAGPVEYRWSTQDYMSVDRVPYIGRLRRTSAHVFTATGFSKWGMTGGTLAAMLLSDRILGRDNPWAELYDSKRIKPKASLKRFVNGNSAAALHFVADRLRSDDADIESLGPGDGAIVRKGVRKRAVYRDQSGALHVLSPVCRHLYCHVIWNPAEESWDCPCHGSRYSGEGEVIQGPTVKPLKRLDLK
jgi:glycine/D-amino acid oxidase-like deaminating enzyme/nitrite reductase/ring-hydroxylating ferredoxin subunit